MSDLLQKELKFDSALRNGTAGAEDRVDETFDRCF